MTQTQNKEIKEIVQLIENGLQGIRLVQEALASQFEGADAIHFDSRILTVEYNDKYYYNLRLSDSDELYFDEPTIDDELFELTKQGVDDITAAAQVIDSINKQLFEENTGEKIETINYFKFGD